MLAITHFTDPACPFAFSAEPRLRRLEWLYGDQLAWTTALVVLSDDVGPMEAKGLTAEMLAKGGAKLGREHGMPIDWTPRERLAASRDACLDVVAAQLRAEPGQADLLLRAQRVLAMGGGLLDGPVLRAQAARDAGIDPDALAGWREEDEVLAALEADRRAARAPSPAARSLDHKLGGASDERRYTCPSLELRRTDDPTRTFSLPGFQPIEAYEAAVGNLAPAATRRAAPGSLTEVLEWARFPLATAEVAAVAGMERDDAHVELAGLGARFEPVGADGYWSTT